MPTDGRKAGSGLKPRVDPIPRRITTGLRGTRYGSRGCGALRSPPARPLMARRTRHLLMDPEVRARIDTLISEAKALRDELDRVRASQRPTKSGVGLFASFVIPSGYKRLARQVGSLWLDSSYQAQTKRLEGVGEAWKDRVADFLGTIRTERDEQHRAFMPERLQTAFARTQRYANLDSRLRHGQAFLYDLKRRETLPATSQSQTQSHDAAAAVEMPPGVMREDRAAPVQMLFPPSVVEKL